MKILLVEDDEMLRKSLIFFLSSKNYKVIDFDNGLDAITYIETTEDKIGLLITDLNLPFAAGQQVIGAMRKSKNLTTPIIVLTSFGIESTELEAYELGADEFVTKPFSPPILLKRIEKLTSN